MIDELHRHLYTKASARKATPRDQQQPATVAALSSSASSDNPGSSSPPPSRRQTAATRQSRSASRSLAMEKESTTFSPPPTIPEDESEVVEDLTGDPEENSSHYMAVLIEALSTLGRVEEALDAIGNRMKREFVLIVERESIRVTRQEEQEAGPLGRRALRDNNPKLLRKLLSNCFAKFHSVVQAHTVLLSHLHTAKKVYNGEYQIYEEVDVWQAIQHVLETTLEQYISSEEEGVHQGGYSALQGASDVQAMFATKRRTGRKGHGILSFRFDSSRHAISINSYMKEQRDLELAEGVERGTASGAAMDQQAVVQHLVCKPSKRNITVIFGPVRDFIKEIEATMCLQGKRCSLHHFIHDFVKHHFLDSLTFDCNKKLENATKSEVARTTASDQKTSKIVGSKQQVLNSVVVVWQLVEDLRVLMKNLSLYSPHFLQIMISLLERYRDSCNHMYRELTWVSEGGGGKTGGGGGGGGRTGGGADYVVSSKWAKDPDINLKIRLLPSWQRLYGNSPHPTEDESKLVMEESQLLVSNLGRESLRKSNVLLDHNSFKLLGILQESLDWFSGHLKHLVMELGRSGAGVLATDGAKMSTMSSQYYEESVTEQTEGVPLDLTEQLSKVQFDFQALSETTVVMLHLEVRTHCFYYLQPALHKVHYVFDPGNVGEDQQVKQLASDLRSIEMVMSAVLTPEKLRYLFDGLGHLVASIFIGSTFFMRKISTHGIKKM
ncbi:Exocyst complex component 4 [Geodia barretti]|nr:Exocyst complex component 4 [Geodia barretti]